ncbi:hypothetical protein [Nonomuraea sp. MG754425]|uniref:hypothetical protein n=1 Tax=Nonomuraea sp. MG754425 TaxID=2570319 RepID=UPI001F2E7C65|nr:hypothetical protein [Nonomuraea sp. MG754425]
MFARLGRSPAWDRDVVLAHQEQLFGTPPSDSAVRRALEPVGTSDQLQAVNLARELRAAGTARSHSWCTSTNGSAAAWTWPPWPSN